jgi:sterol desaturase/sphingolipid hydroxylase (fatty acid hydroxylase superfamily)
VLGLNAVIFVYYVMGYPLRHSHVWISYGPTLSRFFISPAQHQIHHSSAEKHWDKNMGGFFALWDWIFGTLYVPKQREELVYGLPGDEGKEYSGVAQLYVQPFRNNARSRVGIIAVIALLGFFLYFAASQLMHVVSRWIR